MTPRIIVAGILALAVVAAWLRLWLWRRGAPQGQRARTWRTLALAAMQPATAALLFLGLFPPSTPVARGVMVVATGGASPMVGASTGTLTGAILVALPEAPALAGAERAPDLGTALRRHGDVQTLRLAGNGLTPRDIDAVAGRAVQFAPPPARPGLVSLGLPDRVAPGASFSVGGQAAVGPGGRVELVDPAGRVTDRGMLDDQGRFVLTGTTRAAGAALFAVRLKEGGGKVVEQADVPVQIEADAAPRLLILAGAPGPEVKYLRRWATDAGFVVNTQMSAGGGVALGDPPIALDTASLKRFDVAIVDDRSWSARRGALIAAARDGMGLVLRASGPLDGTTRSEWRALGFGLTGGDALAPITLPKPAEAELARTRLGIGSVDAPDDLQVDGEVLPEVSRLGLTLGGPDATPLIKDAGGTTLSAWRAEGLGRIAIFTGIDSYGLTLTGRRALFNDWWSAMLSSTARPVTVGGGRGPNGRALNGPAWVGERVALCGTAVGADVAAPDGTMTLLQPEGDGCAGFWPSQAGWHGLRPGGDGQDHVGTFYVWPEGQLAGVRAARDRQATLMLTRERGGTQAAATDKGPTRRGPSWPWLLAWLALSGGLWAFERSRIGSPAVAR